MSYRGIHHAFVPGAPDGKCSFVLGQEMVAGVVTREFYCLRPESEHTEKPK